MKKAYLADPIQNFSIRPLRKNDSGFRRQCALQPTGLLHRPTNEAELVREKRAGGSDDESDDNTPLAVPEEMAPPVIADAALARALDLLKGIAVLQQSHPG